MEDLALTFCSLSGGPAAALVPSIFKTWAMSSIKGFSSPTRCYFFSGFFTPVTSQVACLRIKSSGNPTRAQWANCSTVNSTPSGTLCRMSAACHAERYDLSMVGHCLHILLWLEHCRMKAICPNRIQNRCMKSLRTVQLLCVNDSLKLKVQFCVYTLYRLHAFKGQLSQTYIPNIYRLHN